MSEVNLESLLGKTEEQVKQEYVKGLVDSVKKKMILPILKAGLSNEKIIETLQECSANGYNSIIALPSYISLLEKQKLSFSSTVAVAINYPFGENVTDSILRDIKYWGKSGIDEIVVVLPLSDIKFNKGKISEKIIKNLVKLNKKKSVSVMIEACMLNDVELGDIAKKLNLFKLNKIYFSSGLNKEDYEDRNISVFKSSKRNSEIKYVSCSKVDSIEALQQALSACDYVMCENATTLLNETLAKVSI